MGASDDPAKQKLSPREAKLAQALRANLRRRKAGADPKAAGEGADERPKRD
jgi:hypothetical protein